MNEKERMQMQKDAEQGLSDELERVLHRWRKEADLTYNQIIGILESKKSSFMFEAYNLAVAPDE